MDWDKVYDVLVKHAGANDMNRSEFIFAHEDAPPCREYRFMGALGFGGKFRSERFTVDCYREDLNPRRQAVIDATNAALAALSKPSAPAAPKE